MKKIIVWTALATSVLLTACSNTTKKDSSSSSTDTATSQQYEKDLAYAINNPKAVFPQLTTDVAENEAAVTLKTSVGDIQLKLFPKQAPLAVENFLTHAKEGYYNGVIFHRVIKNFMIQTGDPKGNGTGGESIWKNKDKKIDSGKGFKNEISAFLYNIRGSLAMANAGVDTNGSQFYINQNPADASANLSSAKYPAKIIEAYKNGGYPSLDGNYTVFGQVISGMDVVDKIAATQTDSNNKPTSDIKIESIEIVKDYDFSKK